MDYQSNNQSGDPQNTGAPYNNTTNSGDTPGNNGNPYNNTASGQNPYGNTGNTGNTGNNGNPYGNSPYNNANHNNANPYNNYNPYNNTNPYPNPYYNGNPYGYIGAKILSPQKNKGEGMATAAMILGIISLISLLLLHFYMPFLLGGVGIILAVLSKGKAKKMLGKARAGLICCITGLALDVTICVFSVYLVFALPDIMPEMVDEVNKMCEEQYGMTYEELMDEIYEVWDIEP